jgi:selenium-binding protein 1
MTLRPDPSFYPSPRLAKEAPPEKHAYVTAIDPAGIAGTKGGEPDALAVVDLDLASPGYGTISSTLEMPGVGDELHHFGWNACSASLCPWAPNPHVERRYLLLPEPSEIAQRAGYSQPRPPRRVPRGGSYSRTSSCT